MICVLSNTAIVCNYKKYKYINMYYIFINAVSFRLSGYYMYLQQILRCQSTHEVKLKNKPFIVCSSSPNVYIERVFHKASFDIRIYKIWSNIQYFQMEYVCLLKITFKATGLWLSEYKYLTSSWRTSVPVTLFIFGYWKSIFIKNGNSGFQ